MLGAARVQVLEYDWYDLKLTREEDGAVETLDPQFFMGSEWLEILESTVFDLLVDPKFVMSLIFLDLLLLCCVCFTSVIDMDFLGDTTLVEMILVKGHVFPSIVNIHPVGFQLYPTLVYTLPVGKREVSARDWHWHGYAVSSLMDTAYWSSE
ncbi:hypothetical protein Tco_0511838 [Tanacetum coccineum]